MTRSNDLTRTGRALRAAMSDEKPELMMPVTDDKAAQLIGIEALRSINRAIDKLGDKIDGQNTTLHELEVRLTRMEANDELLRSIVLKVDALERDKDRRDGSLAFGQWFMKSPVVGWIVAAVLFVAAMFARDKGL